MKKSSLPVQRERIRTFISRIRGDATSVGEQATRPSGGQADGGLSNAPLHLGDLGTDESLHDLNAVLLENEQYLMKEATAALQRIDLGTYGHCENCHKPIPEARLKALPFARYCVSCAGLLDAGSHVNLNAGRPANPSETLALSNFVDGAKRMPIGPLPRVHENI